MLHKRTSSSLLHKHSLSIYMSVRLSIMFTTQMVSVAVGWQIYALTKSAFYLGLVGLVQFVPMVLLTLIVGMIADRFNRKAIICLSEAAQAVVFAFLALGNSISSETILIAVFLLGVCNAFQGPALQSLLPNIVSKEDFARAAASSTSASQVAMVAGPAIGGVLYAFGPKIVYLIAGFCSSLSAILVLFIYVMNKQIISREPVSLRSLLSGIRFIKSKPVVMGAILLDLFAVMFGGATALLPIYAENILHVGSAGLGVLRSAPAIGAVIISLILSRRPFQHSVGHILFASVSCFGLATIIFAVSKSFLLSFLILILLGCSDGISVVIRATLVQIETPNAMLGRVNSVRQLFTGTSNQLGEFESGITANWFGAVPSVLIGGIGTLLIVLLWLRLFPSLYQVDQFDNNSH